MENLTKEELKRIRDTITIPAPDAEDAVKTVAKFLKGCNKKNPSVGEVTEKKEGIFAVDVSYDAEYNNEQDYRYVYIEGLKRIRDIITTPALDEEAAKATVEDFLIGCNKKNSSVDGVFTKKTGIYGVNVSYDAEYNNEQDYTYVYGNK